MHKLLAVPFLFTFLCTANAGAQSPEQSPQALQKQLSELFQQGSNAALNAYNRKPDKRFLADKNGNPLTGDDGDPTIVRPVNRRFSMDEVLGKSTGIDRNALQSLGLRKQSLAEKALAGATPQSTGRKSAEKYLAEGTVKKMSGDLNGSIDLFKKAVAADPEFSAAYYNLACAYAGKSEAEAAIKYLQKAIAFNPDYKEVAGRDSDFANIRHYQSFKDAIK